MANPLSMLGIIHTVISIAPVAIGLACLVRHGAIPPFTRAGKAYLATLALSSITSFGLSSTGGFNAGHAIGILTLLVSGFVLVAERLPIVGRASYYLRPLAMSFTFFLLLIPGINETLSRLPPSNPIGNGPDSPPVQTATALLALIFLTGICYQAWSLHRGRARPSVA
ncbi:hypothetical protein [Ensifer soli]|uniref:hypothetical protein n=1 Tax=Ciceribacter sp. sgz301302 TaxID=3342379 RepID=UPI0035B8A9F9